VKLKRRRRNEVNDHMHTATSAGTLPLHPDFPYSRIEAFCAEGAGAISMCKPGVGHHNPDFGGRHCLHPRSTGVPVELHEYPGVERALLKSNPTHEWTN
jgi:hypothetical protein